MDPKRILSSFLLIIICTATAYSQKMYASLGNGQGIKTVNVTANGCVTDTVIVCPFENYFALALYRDQMYYVTNSTLNVGTLINDTLKNCHPVDITPAPMSSMTVDNTGVIYSASTNVLFRWDPNSGLGFENLGAMPFASAGDMVFYAGDLYMAATTGIVKVNIANPAASTMHIPINSSSIFGMAVLSVDCNQNKAYAFETINGGDASNILELDLVNRTVVGVACQIPFGVQDGASDVESGTFSGIKLRSISIIPQCKVPGKGMIRVIREPGLATYTYTLDGGQNNTTGIFQNVDPGNHDITITTPGGCFKDTSVTVPLFDDPVPVVTEHHIDPDCTTPGKVWFTIAPDNGSNKVIFGRDTVSSSYQFTDLDEGTHHFSIVDQYFCELDAKDITVNIEGSCDTVYFPTAFTPNNDGRNDQFKGLGSRSVRDYHLEVYNRWGQRIFTSSNVLKGWDGKVDGVDQNSGIFIWIATYTTKSGSPRRQKGTVILLR